MIFMKNRTILGALVLLLSWSMVACLKDKGNYEYHAITELKVEGLDKDKKYEMFAFIDTLHIRPDIAGRDPADPDRYSYEWKLMKRGGDDTADSIDHIVGTQAELVLPVVSEPGEYTGFFKVTDRKEATSWGTSFSVLIKSMTNEGFMVLCDDEGQGRLDMISNINENEYLVAYDIWRDKAYAYGQPKALYFNFNRGVGSSTLYVTKAGTYLLDKNLTTDEAHNFKWAFGTNPERILVKGTKSTTFSFDAPRELVVDSEDNLFARNTTMPGAMFEFPVNYINGTQHFKPSAHIGMAIPNNNAAYWPYGHTVLLYDETNQQFLEFRDVNEYPSHIQFKSTGIFPITTARTMVHVGATLNKYTFAILKDVNVDRHYLYGMTLGPDGVNSQNYYVEIQGPRQDDIRCFAVHPILPYVFYATKDKIYQFDYSQPSLAAREVLDYSGSTIATMDFFPVVGWNPYQTWERNKALLLVVGSNKNNGGTDGLVDFYTAPALGQPLVKKKSLNGFGKIIDITLRER